MLPVFNGRRSFHWFFLLGWLFFLTPKISNIVVNITLFILNPKDRLLFLFDCTYDVGLRLEPRNGAHPLVFSFDLMNKNQFMRYCFT